MNTTHTKENNSRKKNENTMKGKNIKYISSFLLIGVSLLITVVFSVQATQRNLTNLETVLLQSIFLIIGLLGSYFFGRLSSRKAAQDLIKPHAKSAFRRLISLYRSLKRMAEVIQLALHQDNNTKPSCLESLNKLEAIVDGQIDTIDDALEDWRDIVPEEIEGLREKLEAHKSSEIK